MDLLPFDKRSGKIWFNGEKVEWINAKVHILNHGLHYASCVFEGERVYDGEIFKLEEHTERLFYSASRMEIKIPYSQKEINQSKFIVVYLCGRSGKPAPFKIAFKNEPVNQKSISQ